MPRPKGLKAADSVSAHTSGTAGAVRAIVASQALPYNAPVVRPRDSYSTDPSSTYRLRYKGTYPFPGVVPALSPQFLDPNETFAVVLRDPRCSFILHDPNSENSAVPYYLTAQNQDIPAVGGGTPGPYDIPVIMQGTQPASTPALGAPPSFLQFKGAVFDAAYPSGWPAHGPFLYAGRSSALPGNSSKASWIWWGGGGSPSAITIFAGVGGLQGNGAFVVWAWNKGTPYVVDGAIVNAVDEAVGVAVVSLESAAILACRDYIAIEVFFATDQVATDPQRVYMQCSLLSNGAQFRHGSAPQISSVEASIDSAAQTGVALLIKNISNELQKDGSVIAYQPPKNTCWQNILPSILPFEAAGVAGAYDVYSAIGAYKGSWESLAATGFYGYLKPHAAGDVYFQKMFNSSVTTGGSFVESTDGWNLDDQNFYWVSFACTTGFNFRYEFSQGGCFYTDSQWYDPLPANIDPDEWEKGALIVSAMPQFFENPLHWNDIWSRIKSGLRRVIGLAPPLLGLIPEAAPFVPAITAIGGGIESLLGMNE